MRVKRGPEDHETAVSHPVPGTQVQASDVPETILGSFAHATAKRSFHVRKMAKEERLGPLSQKRASKSKRSTFQVLTNLHRPQQQR